MEYTTNVVESFDIVNDNFSKHNTITNDKIYNNRTDLSVEICNEYQNIYNIFNTMMWETRGIKFLPYLYTVTCIIGFLANSIIIIVFLKTKKLRNLRNFYIINLAISDLTICTVSAPFTIYQSMNFYFPFNESACKFIASFQAINMFVSCFTLVLIAIDRFFLTHSPISWPQKTSCHILSYVSIWIFAFIITTPYISMIKLYTDEAFFPSSRAFTNLSLELCPNALPPNVCGEDPDVSIILPSKENNDGRWFYMYKQQIYTLTILAIQVLLPLIILIYSYTQIGFVIKHRASIPMTMDANRRHERQKKLTRSILLLTALVLVYALIWFPMNLYHILTVLGLIKYSQNQYITLHFIGVTSVIINPLLYGIINDQFKNAIKETTSQILNSLCGIFTCNLKKKIFKPIEYDKSSMLCDYKSSKYKRDDEKKFKEVISTNERPFLSPSYNNNIVDDINVHSSISI
ncbi:Neuropeptide F receptor [Strongyloides ratti]|uniref:Neuropeptide F receptor n=1 Tax=Strongyloides ratti TaxID=34506 RepID=A0A090L3H7_STRRB|nr:Neuropeptide F receptor [Strongyloides ratti]CEF64361.1 Neuropeptide F receptor [Strongyloides ratti]